RHLRPPAAQTLDQLSPARGTGHRGALFGLYADRPRQPLRSQRRAGSADFAGETRKDCPLTLIAATEAWHTVLALNPDDALNFEGERRRRLVGMSATPAQTGFAAELALAADTFVISPVRRIADGARGARRGRRSAHPDQPAITGLPIGAGIR